MDFTRNLADRYFRDGKNGERIFYPWGIFGKGRILINEQAETKIRTTITRFYAVFVPVSIGTVLAYRWMDIEMSPWILALVLISLATAVQLTWLHLITKSIVSDCPYSEEKLTLKSAMANQAKGMKKSDIKGLLVINVAFVLGGVLMISTAVSPYEIAKGCGATMVFLIFGVLSGYMLKAHKG